MSNWSGSGHTEVTTFASRYFLLIMICVFYAISLCSATLNARLMALMAM